METPTTTAIAKVRALLRDSDDALVALAGSQATPRRTATPITPRIRQRARTRVAQQQSSPKTLPKPSPPSSRQKRRSPATPATGSTTSSTYWTAHEAGDPLTLGSTSSDSIQRESSSFLDRLGSSLPALPPPPPPQPSRNHDDSRVVSRLQSVLKRRDNRIAYLEKRSKDERVVKKELRETQLHAVGAVRRIEWLLEREKQYVDQAKERERYIQRLEAKLLEMDAKLRRVEEKVDIEEKEEGPDEQEYIKQLEDRLVKMEEQMKRKEKTAQPTPRILHLKRPTDHIPTTLQGESVDRQQIAVLDEERARLQVQVEEKENVIALLAEELKLMKEEASHELVMKAVPHNRLLESEAGRRRLRIETLVSAAKAAADSTADPTSLALTGRVLAGLVMD